jgi:hypothetical protein
MIKLYLVDYKVPDVCCTAKAEEARRYMSRDEAQLDCQILNSVDVRVTLGEVEYICRKFEVDEISQNRIMVRCEGRTRAESAIP